MANFYGKSNGTYGTPREILEAKYKNNISNILLIVLFSVINIVLLVTNSDSYFLFSAYIPYFLADYGMYFCGMYPEEYYADVPNMEFVGNSLFIVTISIAAIILISYLVCWFLAKKKKIGFLIAALVFFVIDTIVMLVLCGINGEMIIDIVFHIWVIVSLAMGIVNYNKLKKLPEDVITDETDESEEQGNCVQDPLNSTILRIADSEVNARVLLEANVPGYDIIYRRVKRTNELVVNGMVYDEYEALVEFPHTLTAVIGGHKIEVQYDSTSHMYIIFDGEQIAKKLRLI